VIGFGLGFIGDGCGVGLLFGLDVCRCCVGIRCGIVGRRGGVAVGDGEGGGGRVGCCVIFVRVGCCVIFVMVGCVRVGFCVIYGCSVI
jgi:hypothetical protein